MMWLDVLAGATLVGLHRPQAIGRLARAVRTADRLSAPHAQDRALRLLAASAAEVGYRVEAATLIGYTEANLSASRMRDLGDAWAWAALDDALAGMTQRVVHEAAGAALTRADIMALVARLDAAIGPAAANDD